MPLHRSRDRKIGCRPRAGAAILRAAFGVALAGLIVSLDMSAARAAGDDTTNESAWSKFMQRLGLQKPFDSNADIKYTERSPLVVPPTRDLPPPMAGPPPAPDWPHDDSVRHHKRAKAKPPAPNASGQLGQAESPQRVPNPPNPKKSFFNPNTWFSKEEYATFISEPPRDNLTDPPAGYRTPSPNQPYGIGPEHKQAKKKDANGGTANAQAGK